MIGYVTLGTRDLPRAVKFYDAIAKEMDTPRFMEFETFVAWGKKDGPPGVAVTLPYDKKPATVGNGVMVDQLVVIGVAFFLVVMLGLSGTQAVLLYRSTPPMFWKSTT